MSNQLLNAVENACARLATVLFLEDDGTSDTHAVAREVLKHLRAAIESENARPSSDAELTTLRAENERLRERCEAATFVRYGNVSFQKSLMSGKWIVFRDHHEVTEYLAGDGRESFGNAYADTIDAGWLRDSNNKGGGYRESALTPQQEPGK